MFSTSHLLTRPHSAFIGSLAIGLHHEDLSRFQTANAMYCDALGAQAK